MTDVQTFTAPDGTEMVILTMARYEALLDAEETLEDLEAANEGAASLAAEGGIPFEVSNAIAGGKHPIAAWRKHRGLTQAELAEKTGLTQAAIARLESARAGSGRTETLDALAEALDAPRWALDGGPAVADTGGRAVYGTPPDAKLPPMEQLNVDVIGVGGDGRAVAVQVKPAPTGSGHVWESDFGSLYGSFGGVVDPVITGQRVTLSPEHLDAYMSVGSGVTEHLLANAKKARSSKKPRSRTKIT